MAGIEILALDTARLRRADDPVAWSGEALLAAGFRTLDRDWDWAAGMRLSGRTEGLGGARPALASSARRQEGILRLSRGAGIWNIGFLAGFRAEEPDSGEESSGFTSSGRAPQGLRTGSVAGAEASFAPAPWRGIETVAKLSWIDDPGATALREAHRRGEVELGLPGVRDTFAVAAEHQDDRVRSSLRMVDRTFKFTRGEASWSQARAGQGTRLELELGDSATSYPSGSVPGETARAVRGRARWDGELPWGFSQAHEFSARGGERHSDYSHVEGADEGEEAREAARESGRSLADTLRWRPGFRPGSRLEAGLVRSLESVRYPWNTAPVQGDRPDKDRSETSTTLRLLDSLWGRSGNPLFAWTWFSRDEVPLRSVHSLDTRRREGNRFTFDLATPERGRRWEAGGSAREQRTRYRFDSTQDEGLMETELDAAFELGPADAPRARLSWRQRWTWTGDLVGEDFAVATRTRTGLGTVRAWWRPLEAASLSPWSSLQLERVVRWKTTRRVSDPVEREWRTGLDLSWDPGRWGVSGEAEYASIDPGEDVWTAKLEGNWTW